MTISIIYIFAVIFIFVVGVAWGTGLFEKIFDKIAFSLLYGCNWAAILYLLLKS